MLPDHPTLNPSRSPSNIRALLPPANTLHTTLPKHIHVPHQIPLGSTINNICKSSKRNFQFQPRHSSLSIRLPNRLCLVEDAQVSSSSSIWLLLHNSNSSIWLLLLQPTRLCFLIHHCLQSGAVLLTPASAAYIVLPLPNLSTSLLLNLSLPDLRSVHHQACRRCRHCKFPQISVWDLDLALLRMEAGESEAPSLQVVCSPDLYLRLHLKKCGSSKDGRNANVAIPPAAMSATPPYSMKVTVCGRSDSLPTWIAPRA